MANEITELLRRDMDAREDLEQVFFKTKLTKSNDRKWNKNAVPGKPLKRKLPGTDEEEKGEKNKRYEEHRPERKQKTKWQEGWPDRKKIVIFLIFHY
jgi:hypothetical protein